MGGENVVAPLVGIDSDPVAASVVGAVDQHVAHTGGAVIFCARAAIMMNDA